MLHFDYGGSGVTKSITTTDGFFDLPKEKSKVKTIIVTEFFKAYFPIIYNRLKKDVWYLDLFSGPGMYMDGTKSTPLVLLDVVEAFKDDSIRNHLKMVFNDHDKNYYMSLKEAVSRHPVFSNLRYKPEITCMNASEIDLSRFTSNNDPIFSFVDPWGYKDVSASQVWKLIRNIGSDCVLFFNANRILQDINKTANEQDFSELFGDKFTEAKILQKKPDLTQRQKADGFLSLFSENLYKTVHKERNLNYNVKIYILPFFVEADDKETISHYILFISKSHKAVEEMRKVMIKAGNSITPQLGYDDKDNMQISVLSRKDDLNSSVVSMLKKIFEKNPEKHKNDYDVNDLSQMMDDYAMCTCYHALPYSSSELKTVIEDLDKQGYIDVILPENRQIKKRITMDRRFRIKPTIERI